MSAPKTAEKRAAARPAYEFHPLTPDRWPDLERVFGANGACGGCWCMWWRASPSEFRRDKGAGNRRALRRLVVAGAEPGILAYDADGTPVGWCAIAPRTEYPRLERSRILAPVDDRAVWSVTCFFIARGHRRRGLSRVLLEAAVRFAADRGAAIVEGYPVEPAVRQADPFVWTGLASAFRRAGFREVARRSPTRPIMRRRVRPRKRV
ncbi:MAG: GNAT family N-acetyltransferase [Gemmatimonadota bacterium]